MYDKIGQASFGKIGQVGFGMQETPRQPLSNAVYPPPTRDDAAMLAALARIEQRLTAIESLLVKLALPE